MGFSIGSYQRKTMYRRFWEKVVNGPNGCWNWSGHKNGNGYAQFRVGDRQVLVHRHAYETMVAPLIDGLTIDHLCRNRICVNPEHLEQVTYKENTMRGETPARINHDKSSCINGHKFNEENTYILVDKFKRVHRYCRKCSALRTAKYRAGGGAVDITPQEGS